MGTDERPHRRVQIDSVRTNFSLDVCVSISLTLYVSVSIGAGCVLFVIMYNN
jgi:hypothetical protein